MDTPTGFAVESYTHRSATLVWTDVEDALFYRVYYGLTAQFSEATFFGIAPQGSGRSAVTGLYPETAYNFWIVAEGDDGTMSDPAQATCTTSASPGEDFELEAVVEKAIYDWAVNEFGDYAVIWERQNGTRPGKPFVTLSIKSGPPFGGDDHIRDGARLCGNRSFVVDVNIYSDANPMQMAMDMRTSLQRPDVIDFFNGAKIGVGEINGVTDVSQLLDNSEWEQRAHFDFGVLVASDKNFDVGQISEVDYENQIGGN